MFDALFRTEADRQFGAGLARAFGGAVVFAIPILMTLETWTLGPEILAPRLALFILLTIPLLVGMSHFSGFEETFDLKDDLLDGLAAYAVGFFVALFFLWLVGVIRADMPLVEIVGLVTLEATACSVGAMFAESQFGDEREKEREQRRKQEAPYFGNLFIFGVGALVLSFAIAPTEEVLVLSAGMTGWQVVLLALLSIAILHAFILGEQSSRQLTDSKSNPQWLLLVRFTVVGYAIALLVSAYLLWTFGRLDGIGIASAVASIVVLGFPATVGAAAAHLIF
jgi:putative integral membrane protein (TIGR02587 family)